MTKLLVVEDNFLDMELVLVILKAQCFIVDKTYDGEGAIRWLKKKFMI